MKNMTINEFAKSLLPILRCPEAGPCRPVRSFWGGLVQMVANLTVTKVKYADCKEEMTEIINKASCLGRNC